MPQKILEELAIIVAYGNKGDDWIKVKKHLLLSLPSPLRKYFSTRDPETKKQYINEFEAQLIDIYQGMTGTLLRIYDE
jgi:hypothetical protein